MNLADVVTGVRENIDFFRTGCWLFYGWLDRHANDIVEQTLHEPPPLQARAYRQEKQLYEQREKEYEQAIGDYNEGKRADKPTRLLWLPWACEGYRSSLGTEYYCLTVYPEIGWVPTILVHPLSCFRLSGRHANPLYRPLTAHEQQMADCMTLAFVYSCEMRRQGKEAGVFPRASHASFDLKDFWGHLREKLATSDGERMIEEAWTRTETVLERRRQGQSVWDEPKTEASGPGQAGGTAGGVPHGAVKPEMRSVRDRVFISYSHKDKKWLDELQGHLEPYRRNGLVTAWSDESISPGEKWFAEIKGALALTKVAVLLVTSDFLASEFIAKHELRPLLDQEKKGEVCIIWIPVGACSYKETELKNLQSLVDPDKPLANMKKADRNRIWVKVCEAIKEAVACQEGR